jgi:uncharacterized protein
MNKSLKESLIYIVIVLGLSYFVLWGPIAFFNLQAANMIEGKIYNPIAFAAFILGGFIPSFAGLLLTRIYDGKKSFTNILRSSINFRIGKRTYFTIILTNILLGFFLILLYTSTGQKFVFSNFIKQLPSLIPLIIAGPLSEEYGWRGFLQKRFNTICSPVIAALITGIIWSLWHLPLFYMSGTSQHDFNIPFLQFLISITSISLAYNYVLIKSNGMVFTAILFHWLNTYILQVISSNVIRTPLYNSLECIPTLSIGIFFGWMLLKKEKEKQIHN